MHTTESIYEKLDELYAAGEMAHVEEFLFQALLMNQPFGGNINAAYITVLYELGVFFLRAGKTSRSLDWFLLLRGVVRDHLGEDSFEHAVVMENMAAIYECLGEYNKALQTYLRTLKIYKKTIGAGNKKYAEILGNARRLYLSQKDYKSAVMHHENMFSVPPVDLETGNNANFAEFLSRMGVRNNAETYSKYDVSMKTLLN